MYAPKAKNVGPKVWHKIHPLDLSLSICKSGNTLLNCNEVVDELPPDAIYCKRCKQREHFAAPN